MPSSKSIQNIQALRAVAATLVIFQHILIVSIGSFGVDIFFVISGFVIAYVSVSETPGTFVLKRLFRIVPLYWLGTLAVFAVAAVAPSLVNSTTTDIVELFKSLLFIPYVKDNGLTHPVLFLGWTLNYEMLFYVIFAIALTFGSRAAPFIATIILLSLILIGLLFPIDAEPFRFWTRPLSLEFLFGVWIFVAWHKGIRLPVTPVFALSIAAALVVLMGWEETRKSFDWIEPISFGIPAAAVVVLALACEGKIKVPAVLLAIGDASYSLYLFHPYLVIPVQKIISHFTPDPIAIVLAVPFMVAASIGLALVSYRIIERPSNLWLRSTLMAPRARAVPA
jgi:peptidoglycan/LPS O-acetylase OafA/YrhL